MGSAALQLHTTPQPEHSEQGSTSAGEHSLSSSHVGWSPRGDMGIAEWSAVGRRFGEIGRCSQWWLGDWIHYGNLRFGERYSRAVKLTGYDAQSLMNMVYVASRFEISRRRENLSWSHHATLAALDVETQDHWLTRASEERMSVADLRVELRGRRRALKALDDPLSPAPAPDPPRLHHAPEAPSGAHGTGALVCPTCGGAVPLSD